MGQTRTNPEWPWVADVPKQMTSVIIRALMMSPQASRRSHQAQGGRGDAGRNAWRTLPRERGAGSVSLAPSCQTSAITEGEPVARGGDGLAPKGELNRGVPRWPGSPSSVRDTWCRAAGRAFRAPRVPSDDRAGQGRPSAPGTVRARFQGGRTARTNRAKLVSRSEVALAKMVTGLTNRPQRDVEKVTRRQTAAVSVGGSRVEGANQDGAEVAPTGRSVARRAFPGLRLADVAADPSTGMAWCKPLLFSSVEDQQ